MFKYTELPYVAFLFTNELILREKNTSLQKNLTDIIFSPVNGENKTSKFHIHNCHISYIAKVWHISTNLCRFKNSTDKDNEISALFSSFITFGGKEFVFKVNTN